MWLVVMSGLWLVVGGWMVLGGLEKLVYRI